MKRGANRESILDDITTPEQKALVGLRHVFNLTGKGDVVRLAKQLINRLADASGLGTQALESPHEDFRTVLSTIELRIKRFREAEVNLESIAGLAAKLGWNGVTNSRSFITFIQTALDDAREGRETAAAYGWGSVGSMRAGLAGIKQMAAGDAPSWHPFPEGKNLGHAVQERLERKLKPVPLPHQAFTAGRLVVNSGKAPVKDTPEDNARIVSFAFYIAGSLRLLPEYTARWGKGWVLEAGHGVVHLYCSTEPTRREIQDAQGLLIDAARWVWEEYKPAGLHYEVQ